MTTEGQDNNNSIVILSDDDEDDVALNENGKRPHSSNYQQNASGSGGHGNNNVDDDGDEEYYSDEEMDTEDEEYAMYEEEENNRNAVYLNRSLPEDHEPVILSEREQVNTLQEINDVFQELKDKVLKTSASERDVETNYSCGGPLNEEAPSVALNIIGVSGPIAFPMDEKDATRILDAHPTIDNEKGDCIGLNMDVAHITMSKTFEEYLNDVLLNDVVEYLGVERSVAENTKLVANKFHIRTNGGTLELPDSLNEASYGAVVLVLPTDFTGGDVLTTYNNDDVKYQPEETAFEGCYYMAWYNNVKSKFYPVTEGHQVAISFSLTHDGATDKATSEYLQKRRQEVANGELSPSEIEESKPYIDRAVTFFKDSRERPFPIFYMLDYRYTSPSLQVDKLKRPDKILAKTLQKAADEAGFLMYLGSVEREVEGKVYEEGKPHDSNNTEEGDDCPIDEEGIYLTQKAIYDEYVLRKIYNEQGKNILNIPVGLDSSDHPSIIQGPIWYSRCKPSDVDYSGTVEVEDVTVKYYYSENQALIFMPKTKLPSLLKMSKASSTEE